MQHPLIFLKKELKRKRKNISKTEKKVLWQWQCKIHHNFDWDIL